MRRQSLVEEFQGKDIRYVQSRINDVLRSLPQNDRNEVLASYSRDIVVQTAKEKDKQFFLAQLLDSLLDRKSVNQNSQQQPPQQQRPVTASAAASVATQQHILADSNNARHTRAVSAAAAATQNRSLKVLGGSISSPTSVQSGDVDSNRIGDYVYIKTLGKGTFGKVKLAEHIVTKQQVAIKIIERSNIKTNKQRISVDREVRLMKLLNHPHIVGAIEVYESPECIWIVMEFASGGELFDYIVKNGMIKEPEARHFFRQILSAVEYCHMNSIIHRDLKPENLLLDDKHNIRIIDFGFGNTFHRDRLLDTYCGSPFYAAPEMIQGIRYIGPEVDVWSLGVILFALLSGKLPFDAATMNELYEKIAKGKYTCPSHFSAEAVHLIQRMLQVDPKRRATIAEIRNHSWVNAGYKECINSYIKPRPQTVPSPNQESLAELASYGFRQEDAAKILRTETQLHPIVSLYHLIDEARIRKEEQLYRQFCQGNNEQQQQHSKDPIGDLIDFSKPGSFGGDRHNSLATIDSVQGSSGAVTGRKDSTASRYSGRVSIGSGRQSYDYQAVANTYPNVSGGISYPTGGSRASPTSIQPGDMERIASKLQASSAPTPAAAATMDFGSNHIMTRRRSINAAQQQQMTMQQHQQQQPQQPPQQQQQPNCGPIPTRGLLYPQGYTQQPLTRIHQEIERSLGINKIRGQRMNDYCYVCEEQSYRFRIDIVRRVPVPAPISSAAQQQQQMQQQQQSIIHDLQVNLLSGGSFWNQRQLANRLFKDMRL